MGRCGALCIGPEQDYIRAVYWSHSTAPGEVSRLATDFPYRYECQVGSTTGGHITRVAPSIASLHPIACTLMPGLVATGMSGTTLASSPKQGSV